MKHHDADLCKRLAIKLGIGERVHYREDDPDSGFYEDERGQEIDFCCNYAHGGMLEQKILENCVIDTHSYQSTDPDFWKKATPFTVRLYDRDTRRPLTDSISGASRLHATALALDATLGDEG